MKKTLAIWVSSIILLSVMVVPFFHSAQAKPVPAAPASHPEYHDAISDLRSARKHLEKALDDGYGHRDEAMRTIDHAINECEEALHKLR